MSLQDLINQPGLTELFNEQQSAEYLGGLTSKALQAWRVRGGGPTFLKIGRLVRYSKADLDAWLATRRRQSTSDTGRGSK